MHLLSFVGDLLQMASLCFFFTSCQKNASGISLKAQELSFLVFLLRYHDIVQEFQSYYSTFMKLLSLGLTGATVYTVRYKEPAKSTYSSKQDSMKYGNIVLLTGILAIFVNLFGSNDTSIAETSEEMEVVFDFDLFLWTYSICLETFAMLPQLNMFRKNRHLQPSVQHAMMLRGTYRVFYLCHWIHLGLARNELQIMICFAGTVQVLLYLDFFAYHASNLIRNGPSGLLRSLSTAAPEKSTSTETFSDRGYISAQRSHFNAVLCTP